MSEIFKHANLIFIDKLYILITILYYDICDAGPAMFMFYQL